MTRREFLAGSAASALAVRAERALRAARADTTPSAPRRQAVDPAKLTRVAIMTYSFDRIMRVAGRPDDPARTLDLLDIPEMMADRYQVHNVEVQHAHFPSTGITYVREFRARLAATKSQVTNINLEFGGMNISAPDPALRQQAVDLTRQWIDHAVELGCPRVMVNQGSPTQENKAAAIAALTAMGEYGASKHVMVAMENRGSGPARDNGAGASGPAGATSLPPPPPPSTPAWVLLAEIIKASGTWANCDLGNFPDEATQHDGMRALFAMTDGNCHVKLNPARYDLPTALALTRALGYKGLYSIEAGGGGDPYENVQRIYDVLVANL
jgi:hypothetical protein